MKKTYLKPEMKEVTLMIKTNLMLITSGVDGERATEEVSEEIGEIESGSFD